MRAALILVFVTILSACSVPTAMVRSQAVSYDDAIEDTTNKLLVLNILRAKDKAPLHFDEIPSIHESIQATASLAATYPFGPRPATSPGRNSFTPGLNIQVSPSFEIDHLDTKDFITGLASPIDPKFVKFWLDRGLDRRVVLLLFFSGVDIVDADSRSTIHIRNSPRDALENLQQLSPTTDGNLPLRCDEQSDFQHYLRFINTLTTFSAKSYTERRKLAEGLQLESAAARAKSGADSAIKDLGTLAALDPTKFQWVRDSERKTYTIYAISSEPKTALCDSGYQSGAPTPAQPNTATPPTECTASVYTTPVDDPMAASGNEYRTLTFTAPTKKPDKRSEFCDLFDHVVESEEQVLASEARDPHGHEANANAARPKRGLRLQIRSVGEVIQFLGDLLEYQEALEKLHKSHRSSLLAKLNNPLTFGYCGANPTAGCNDVFFNLRHDSCNVRFSLSYRQRKYSVPNYNAPDDSSSATECPLSDPDGNNGGAGPTPPKDHTLEILAVVNQLIDLQKSAQDIRETPYIQVLP